MSPPCIRWPHCSCRSGCVDLARWRQERRREGILVLAVIGVLAAVGFVGLIARFV